MVFMVVLSIWRRGKCSSKSPKVKIPSSVLSRSALRGPTPLRYSIGLSNMEGVEIIFDVYNKNKGIYSCYVIYKITYLSTGKEDIVW